MVGKAAGGDLCAGGRQRREELFRPPDAGEGKHTPALQSAAAAGSGSGRARMRGLPARSVSRATASPPAPSPITSAVGARPLRGKRRAQRSGREAQAVADARLAVDDGDRQILGERRVLQAVVHDDDARAARDGEPRAGRAGRARRRSGRRARAGAARRRRRRAVAGRVDQNRPGEAAAIAAGEEERALAQPRSASRAMASAVGVLPAPPAVKLPTQITGTRRALARRAACAAPRPRRRRSRSRRAAAARRGTARRAARRRAPASVRPPASSAR